MVQVCSDEFGILRIEGKGEGVRAALEFPRGFESSFTRNTPSRKPLETGISLRMRARHRFSKLRRNSVVPILPSASFLFFFPPLSPPSSLPLSPWRSVHRGRIESLIFQPIGGKEGEGFPQLFATMTGSSSCSKIHKYINMSVAPVSSPFLLSSS